MNHKQQEIEIHTQLDLTLERIVDGASFLAICTFIGGLLVKVL